MLQTSGTFLGQLNSLVNGCSVSRSHRAPEKHGTVTTAESRGLAESFEDIVFPFSSDFP